MIEKQILTTRLVFSPAEEKQLRTWLHEVAEGEISVTQFIHLTEDLINANTNTTSNPNDIQIGSLVRVVDRKEHYGSWTSMFEQMGFKSTHPRYFQYKPTDVFRVFAEELQFPRFTGDIVDIYGIENTLTGEQFLMQREGIELVEPKA